MQLKINKKSYTTEVDGETPLLWVLRDELGLTGTKFGCGRGLCGACTVHIDGVAVRSCTLPASAVTGKEITTIEGLGGRGIHPVQQAWLEQDVPQCGYCQPGMIMACAAMLKQTPHPTDRQIDEQITNVCRCGTYSKIRTAIHTAAGRKGGQS